MEITGYTRLQIESCKPFYTQASLAQPSKLVWYKKVLNIKRKSCCSYLQLPIAGYHRLSLLVSTFPLFIIIHLDQSISSFFLELSRKHAPFRHSVLLHPSGGNNCLTRCWLQMILKPQVREKCGNRTREHQFGYQSSYWQFESVLNFSDLTRTGVTATPTHINNINLCFFLNSFGCPIVNHKHQDRFSSNFVRGSWQNPRNGHGFV